MRPSVCRVVSVAGWARTKAGREGCSRQNFVHRIGLGNFLGGFTHVLTRNVNIKTARTVRGRKDTVRAAFDGYSQEVDILGDNIAEDFYSVLGVVRPPKSS